MQKLHGGTQGARRMKDETVRRRETI